MLEILLNCSVADVGFVPVTLWSGIAILDALPHLIVIKLQVLHGLSGAILGHSAVASGMNTLDIIEPLLKRTDRVLNGEPGSSRWYRVALILT